MIGEFATERRVVIGYDDMAPVLRQAIMATEDADFEQHFGLSISRIAMTAVKDVVTGQRAGASTITQQLARNLFLQATYMRGGVYERSLERKIREAILAVQLERRFTKREIFALYANQVPLHGAYGVEAGARMYFNKSAKDVTLDEAATIAAIIQTPARLSPFVNPERTLARRNNYVLPRMAEEGFVTRQAAAEAAEKPIVLRGQPTAERSFAAYFVEDIRKNLEQRFGAAALYETGLQVQTTLDVELQRAAERAVDRGLRRVDKRRERLPQAAPDRARPPTRRPRPTRRRAGRQPIAAGDIVPGGGDGAAEGRRPAARASASAPTEVDLPRAAFAWTRKTNAADLFAVGDVIEVAIGAIDKGQYTQLTLEQAPIVEGALVAIDNRTGQIRAMVGGFDFARSKFNRATQARRQVGSLFKPVLYAAAIDRGLHRRVGVHRRAGVVRRRPEPAAVSAAELRPEVRRAGDAAPRARGLAQHSGREGARSRRAAEQVVGYAKRLGLTGSYPPYLSLALGAAESTLLEMTSAYSAFANQGVRMTPYAVRSVTDREGTIIEENRPEPREALRADTAFLMAHLLEGVVQRGTAVAAKSLEWPLAGKTGTMDEFTDAWFVGFDPERHRGRLGGLRREAAARQRRDRRAGGAADLDRLHARLHRQARRPRQPAAVRGARQHRLRHAAERRHRGVHQRHPARRHDARSAGDAAGRHAGAATEAAPSKAAD